MVVGGEEATPIAGASAGAAAAPVAIVALGIIDLSRWGTYQRELADVGYIILDDPLGVCIGNCHNPNPIRAPRDFPRFDLDPDLWLRPWPEPRPWPTPDPQPRRRRRRCLACLHLPIGKRPHFGRYQGLAMAHQLAAGYPDGAPSRPRTRQVDNWLDAMDPDKGGEMDRAMFDNGLRILTELNCDKGDKACAKRMRKRVLLPD